MKKIGTLNTHLSRVIAGMGHMDRLVICDCGLPIPRGKRVVDLALKAGIPGFMETLEVVLEELQVEAAVVAGELGGIEGGVGPALQKALGGVPITTVSHEEFKRMSGDDSTVAFVRTGEATPYANVMLVSGVTFG